MSLVSIVLIDRDPLRKQGWNNNNKHLLKLIKVIKREFLHKFNKYINNK